MTEKLVEEFMTVGDYCKVYDLLNTNKREFLDTYPYITNESYESSFKIAMQPKYLADLFRQAENLFSMESDVGLDRDEIDYMQEAGTDYISSADWKWVISKFIANHYTQEQFEDFVERITSCGV